MCTCSADCGEPCAGKECGDDGCSGTCGECEPGYYCNDATCDSTCGVGGCEPGEGEDICTCPADCGDPCEGKECGDDGCGGTCGDCAAELQCLPGYDLCVGEPKDGDLVLTELMTNGNIGSTECTGKADWFEVLNLSDNNLNLNGCGLMDDKQVEQSIEGDLVIKSKQFFLFVQATSLPDELAMDNAYAYGLNPNINMPTPDSISLVCGGLPVFSMDYGSTEEIPLPGTDPDTGKRVAVQVGMVDDVLPTLGDAEDDCNWCPAVEETQCGDKGTPGTKNSPCGECFSDCEGKECGSDGCCETCGDNNGGCPAALTCVDGAGLCARPAQAGELVITEYMTHGSAACTGSHDWIEILNLTKEALSLENCTLLDSNDSQAFDDEDDVPPVIKPESYLILFQAPEPLDVFPEADVYFYGGLPNIKIGDDKIKMTCDAQLVFEIGFGSFGDFTAPTSSSSPENRISAQLNMPPGMEIPEEVTKEYAHDHPDDNWCLSDQAMAMCGDPAPVNPDKGTPGQNNTECP